MDRTAHIMMTVLNDKLTNRLWTFLTPVIIFMVFMPQDSTISVIARYIGYVLVVCAVARMIYVLIISRKKDYPEFRAEDYGMNAKKALRYSFVGTLVAATILIIAIIFKIPVILPTGLLLVFAIIGLVTAWRRCKKSAH